MKIKEYKAMVNSCGVFYYGESGKLLNDIKQINENLLTLMKVDRMNDAAIISWEIDRIYLEIAIYTKSEKTPGYTYLKSSTNIKYYKLFYSRPSKKSNIIESDWLLRFDIDDEYKVILNVLKEICDKVNVNRYSHQLKFLKTCQNKEVSNV